MAEGKANNVKKISLCNHKGIKDSVQRGEQAAIQRYCMSSLSIDQAIPVCKGLQVCEVTTYSVAESLCAYWWSSCNTLQKWVLGTAARLVMVWGGVQVPVPCLVVFTCCRGGFCCCCPISVVSENIKQRP